MKEAVQERRERVTLTVLSALLSSPNNQRVSSYELAKKAVKQADAVIKELDIALAVGGTPSREGSNIKEAANAALNLEGAYHG